MSRALVQAVVDRRSEILREVDSGPDVSGDRNGTRDRVLVEAIRLFARKGVDSCTMRDVASATGIKAPALYNHFGSKEEILAEAMRLALGTFLRDVLEPLDAYEPHEWLSNVVRRHVMFQLENVDLAVSNDLLLARDRRERQASGNHGNGAQQLQREYYEFVRDLVRGATGMRASSRLNILTFSIIAMCDRTNSWYRPGGSLTTKDVADETWSIVRQMLQRR
jgi:TetR/AcrR family transcriptional regulator, cholesterol catabolism regulator